MFFVYFRVYLVKQRLIVHTKCHWKRPERPTDRINKVNNAFVVLFCFQTHEFQSNSQKYISVASVKGWPLTSIKKNVLSDNPR